MQSKSKHDTTNTRGASRKYMIPVSSKKALKYALADMHKDIETGIMQKIYSWHLRRAAQYINIAIPPIETVSYNRMKGYQ